MNHRRRDDAVAVPDLPHAWLVRLGLRKGVSLITAGSVLLSWLLTGIGLAIGWPHWTSNPNEPWMSLGVATIVPLIVAPLASSWVLGVLMRLQEALVLVARLAHTDALTGLTNRRGFAEAAGRELQRCRQLGQAVVVLVADIDNFKLINDRNGHAAGDEVITLVGEACVRIAPAHAIVARLGGEEFALLIGNIGPGEASTIAEGLRAAISSMATNIPVTASIGGAFDARAEASLDVLIQRADAQLYAAKDAGKNRVNVSIAPMPTDHPGAVAASGPPG